jgi:hypothetical protein
VSLVGLLVVALVQEAVTAYRLTYARKAAKSTLGERSEELDVPFTVPRCGTPAYDSYALHTSIF